MAGPSDRPSGEREWKGVGCGGCPLRSACTSGKQRRIVVHPEFERLRAAMRARMTIDGAAQRYSRRIAAFARVHVSAGARTALDIPVRLRDLDRWDDALAANVVDPGEYNLEVGTCLSTAGVVSDVFPCTPLAGAVTIA